MKLDVTIIFILMIVKTYFDHEDCTKLIPFLCVLLMLHAELMILGFISLLMTFGQSYITKICISHAAADTMLPCRLKKETIDTEGDESHDVAHHHRLLSDTVVDLGVKRRVLMRGETGSSCPKVSGSLVFSL